MGADAQQEGKTEILGQVRSNERITYAQLTDQVVIAGRVAEGCGRHDNRTGHSLVTVDEVELRPGGRHGCRVLEGPQVLGQKRRRVEDGTSSRFHEGCGSGNDGAVR